ncbi:MAG TPA: FAD-dependent oxidoreductase [Caulobacteraceae bacterium]|nr:FAD-dependent oxidoreductase [Caulobacteraceae bacterium]
MPAFNSVAALARVRISLRLWFATYQTYKRVYHPFVDLGVRLSLAGVFLHSGMSKAMDWAGALYLARHEYPVSWMSPDHAAMLGLAVELIAPVLLALGLFTRLAALALAILALVIQVNYQTLDTNLYWAAILFSYVVFGARALSLDALLTAGVADSALPIMPDLVRTTRRLMALGGPAFQLLLRLWLGWSLLGWPAPHALFPEASARGALPAPMSVLGGAMLALGVGATIINKLLAAVVFGTQMMTANMAASFWLILLLARFGVIGAGPWSIDAWLYERLVRWMKPTHGTRGAEDWPRVVIVGAGFGGMACAAKLRHLPVRVTLIDQHNYHLFQPLLYQVATAGLSPADIASPIRSQFRDDPSVRVVMDTVTGIDTRRQAVLMGDRELPYDLLVLATGASHSYFGRDAWASHAPGLKRVDDATAVRARLLTAFEWAENCADAAEREAALTFVVVGGGPTGVELAGAIAELARFGLQAEFRHIDPAAARIILIQAGPRVLPAFPESLSARAQRSLEHLGVEVLVDNLVQDIDARGVTIDGRLLRARTVLWAAGVVASPAARWLELEADPSGRAPVDEYLRPRGHPNVFVIGDTAASLAWGGRPVPGLAPAAKQGGEYVATVIRSQLEMRPPPPAFAYRHQGSLATIGRRSAVADFGRLRLWGALAWWLWGAVHVLFLAGMRNRVSVVTAWVWAYLTFRGGTRLITGSDGAGRLPTDASPVRQ